MVTKRVFIIFFIVICLCFGAFVWLYFISEHQVQSSDTQKQLLEIPQEARDIPPLTLELIKENDLSLIASLPQEDIRTVLATGDVLLARTVNFKNTQSGNFHWPFEKTADVLRSSDITFINLETPLVSNCPLSNEGFRFCGDLRNIDGLDFAGVDVVNLANNHAGNFGMDGVTQTLDALRRAGFLVSGIDGPVYTDVEGMRFAFLGYNEVDNQPGVSGAEESIIRKEVNEANENADVVIVQFHWGNEYTTEITPSQRNLGTLAIDSGADLVIGNHPHWIQPFELYNNALITYAHGNFIFDQEWSEETKTGVVGKYTFYKDKLIAAEFLPVRIEDFGQPYFLTGMEKQQVLDSLLRKSKNLPLR